MDEAHVSPDQLDKIGRDELARRHVWSAENWLRKLIDYQLSNSLGPKYITKGKWKKSLVMEVTRKLSECPSKFTREIDTTTFDQAIDIVCHPDCWGTQFRAALTTAYPCGQSEARIFLSRLKDIRNDIAHGRGCSARQLEQAICYSNDLADAVKEFFKKQNMHRIYNVPMIVRYVDNLGNESNLNGVPEDISSRHIDWRRAGRGDLHTGFTLTAEVDVDPSFDEAEYQVRWFALVPGFSYQTGKVARVQIGNIHVGEQMELHFEVISNKDWHRQHGLDDSLCLIFRVLPPI